MSAKDLALNLLIKAKDMASGVVRNFKEEVQDSGQAAEDLERSLDSADDSIDELKESSEDAGKATGHFANQLTDADKAAGRYYDSAGRLHDANGKFVKGAKRARTEADELGDELAQTGKKASGLSGRLGTLTGKLKGFVAASAAGVGLKWLFEQSIGSAARFERQMNRVEAVTNATAEEMAVLEKAADEAGSTTEYSSVQAAEGLEILGRAGFNARQSVELLPSVLAVAAAEGVDLAEAAGLISDTLSVMQLEVAKGSKVTDILARGSSLAYTSMSELGLAISYAGQYAKPANLDLEQLVAVLDVLAKNSLRGERGGTGLRSILAQLSDPASKASQAIKQLNLPTDDFIGLIEGLRQKGPEATEAINAFGIEAGPALRALIAAGSEGILEFEQQLRDVDGAVKQMAKTATDDLPGGIKEAESAWDGLIKTFGKPLLKPLTELARDLAAKFRELKEDGNLRVWGEITAGALEKVAGGLRIIYNTATFATKAIGVFAGQIVSWVADAELQVAKLMNRIGLVGDETVTSLEVQSGAVKAALNALVSEAEEDLRDMGAGWDLLSGKVQLGMEEAGKAADQSGQKAKAAGEAAAEGAKTAEQAAKDQAQAQQEAAEAAAKFAQAQSDAWETLGHDVDEVTGSLTNSGSAAITAFETIATSGKASAEQIELAFASALAQAKSQEDILALERSLQSMGKKGHAAAEQVATGLMLADRRAKQLANTATNALERSLQALGVDIVKIRTGFSEVGRVALDEFDAIQEELKRTGIAGEQAAEITRDSFEGALNQISTTAGLDELKAKLLQAAKEGRIGWDDYRKGLEAIEAKYDDLEQAAKDSIFGQTDALKNLRDEAGKAGKALSGATSATSQNTDAKEKNNSAYEKSSYQKWADTRATEANSDANNENAKSLGSVTRALLVGGKTLKDWEAMGGVMADRYREIAQQSQKIISSTGAGTLGYIAALKRSSEYLERAGNAGIRAWEQQLRRIEAVEQALERGRRVSEGMLHGLDLIDQQRLDNVRSSIRSMNAEAQQLGDTLKGTVASLQQQLADLQGDRERAEQYAQEQRMLQLQEQYQEARKSGNSEAVSAARKAMRLQEQIHRERMSQLRAQKRAEEEQRAETAQSPVPGAQPTATPSQTRSPLGSITPNKVVEIRFPTQAGPVSGMFEETGAEQVIRELQDMGRVVR